MAGEKRQRRMRFLRRTLGGTRKFDKGAAAPPTVLRTGEERGPTFPALKCRAKGPAAKRPADAKGERNTPGVRLKDARTQQSGLAV